METTEIREAREQIQQALKDFREANDKALKGKADQETVEKLNNNLTQAMENLEKLQKQSTRVETRLDHLALNMPSSKPADEKSQQEQKLFEIMARHNGRQAQPEGLPAYNKAFEQFIRKGSDAMSPEMRAELSVGEDPAGGYWVQPAMVGQTVRFMYETSPIRQIANVVTIGTDELEGLYDLDQAGAGWVGETESRPETTTPEIGKYKISVHEQYAEPHATQKLLDDAAFDVPGWLAGHVGARFSRLEATAFVTGNGVNQPRGFLTHTAGAPASTSVAAYRKIEQTNTGVNGGFHATLPGDVFFTCEGLLKPEFRMNARWVMKRLTEAAVRKIKDGQGNYLWQPDFRLGVPATLIGYPITIADDMPTIATDSLSIALGDFRQGYTIVDRIGIRTLRDPYTQKPYVKFYTTRRVGGDVVNFEAIKLIKFAT